MKDKGFDEYGHYGENNPPLRSKASQLKDTECPPIRPMTDEERQRATVRYQSNRLKGKNNDQSNTD